MASGRGPLFHISLEAAAPAAWANPHAARAESSYSSVRTSRHSYEDLRRSSAGAEGSAAGPAPGVGRAPSLGRATSPPGPAEQQRTQGSQQRMQGAQQGARLQAQGEHAGRAAGQPADARAAPAGPAAQQPGAAAPPRPGRPHVWIQLPTDASPSTPDGGEPLAQAAARTASGGQVGYGRCVSFTGAEPLRSSMRTGSASSSPRRAPGGSPRSGGGPWELAFHEGSPGQAASSGSGSSSGRAQFRLCSSWTGAAGGAAGAEAGSVQAEARAASRRPQRPGEGAGSQAPGPADGAPLGADGGRRGFATLEEALAAGEGAGASGRAQATRSGISLCCT